jgi:putative DNA-invertase from lambdoid prophage Rac
LGQVAIYCRVSTDDQCCERQERDLKAFARRSGHKVVAVFKETASGADDDRPERKKVMALARAREIEAIIKGLRSRWRPRQGCRRDLRSRLRSCARERLFAVPGPP